MCGILAAEYQTLPKPMRSAVINFFDENQKWLEGVLAQGKADKTLAFTGSAADVAQGILIMLEGSMLVARPYGDLARFNSAAHQLLVSLTADHTSQ
jgi:TetR/AcrR family transcriptional repressor of nem operon